MDEYRVLNAEGLRYADEFVKHKVLDAIGDLPPVRPPPARVVFGAQGRPCAQQPDPARAARGQEAWELVSFDQEAATRPRFSHQFAPLAARHERALRVRSFLDDRRRPPGQRSRLRPPRRYSVVCFSPAVEGVRMLIMRLLLLLAVRVDRWLGDPVAAHRQPALQGVGRVALKARATLRCRSCTVRAVRHRARAPVACAGCSRRLGGATGADIATASPYGRRGPSLPISRLASLLADHRPISDRVARQARDISAQSRCGACRRMDWRASRFRSDAARDPRSATGVPGAPDQAFDGARGGESTGRLSAKSCSSAFAASEICRCGAWRSGAVCSGVPTLTLSTAPDVRHAAGASAGWRIWHSHRRRAAACGHDRAAFLSCDPALACSCGGSMPSSNARSRFGARGMVPQAGESVAAEKA